MPKENLYPAGIARELQNRVVAKHVANFYTAIGDMVLDELMRDLTMQANHCEVTGRQALGHELKLAVRHIADMRRQNKYPKKVKFG